VQLDASPDCGIERFIFRQGILHPGPSFLRGSFAAMHIGFRVAFLLHGIQLSFERQLPQQSFDALKPVVTIDRELERLALQGCVARV